MEIAEKDCAMYTIPFYLAASKLEKRRQQLIEIIKHRDRWDFASRLADRKGRERK
jgi:hypothetical protein